MILRYLRYRYTKARMTAYINSELPTKTRRFIARQIDSDPRCYDVYLQHRQTKQELERDLLIFGKADAPQLQNIWTNIQSELNAPTIATTTTNIQPRPQMKFSLGYGLAIVLCVFALMLPMFVETNTVHASGAPIEQAIPEVTSIVTVQKVITVKPTSIAQVIETDVETIEAQVTDAVKPKMQNTPDPLTPAS